MNMLWPNMVASSYNGETKIRLESQKAGDKMVAKYYDKGNAITSTATPVAHGQTKEVAKRKKSLYDIVREEVSMLLSASCEIPHLKRGDTPKACRAGGPP